MKNYKTFKECLELVNRGVPSSFKLSNEFMVLQRFLAFSVQRIYTCIEEMDYVYSPDFVSDRLLPLLADTVGIVFPIGGEFGRLRLLLKYYQKILKNRGTINSIKHMTRILEMDEVTAYIERLTDFDKIRVKQEYILDEDKYNEYLDYYEGYQQALASGLTDEQKTNYKITLDDMERRAKIYFGCIIIETDYVTDFDYANDMLRHVVHAGFRYEITNIEGIDTTYYNHQGIPYKIKNAQQRRFDWFKLKDEILYTDRDDYREEDFEYTVRAIVDCYDNLYEDIMRPDEVFSIEEFDYDPMDNS